MEHTIYFAIGFKSFDTPWSVDSYEWTEWSRNAITRTLSPRRQWNGLSRFSLKLLRPKENVVKRWKKKKTLSETFCARKFNKYGRYISLIIVRGRRKSAIIIPELTFNSVWAFIAEKTRTFTANQKRETGRDNHRLTDNKLPFAEAVRFQKQ